MTQDVMGHGVAGQGVPGRDVKTAQHYHDIGVRRWWAAAALAISGLVIGIDGTVLNLALPTLATDLHATTSELQWFVDAYLLVLGAVMLPAGLLGDRFGRKRLLLGALAVFALGSLACSYAWSPETLIAARVLLGLGAAFILPLSIGVLPVFFAEHERQRAIAIVASAAIASYPLGPLVGGWLLNHYWWGSVFLINVPVIAVAIVAVAVLMPESRGGSRGRLDSAGVLLSTVGLVLLTYGLIEAGQRGWDDPRAVGCMVAGAVVLVGFVWWELRIAARPGRLPLVDLALFRSVSFTVGTALSTLVSFVMIGLLFAAPLYLRSVLGYDAMATGVRLLPMIGGMIVGLGLGDRLSGLIGAKFTVTAGFVLTAVGFGLAAATDVHDGTGYLATWITIVGLGIGAVMPSAMNAAVSRLTSERSAVGSALIAAVRQVGATFGVALLGSLLNSAYRDRLDLAGLPERVTGPIRDGVSSGVAVARQLGSETLLASVRSAFVHGMDVLLAVSGGVAVVGALLALALLPRGLTRRSTTGNAVERSENGTVPHRPAAG